MYQHWEGLIASAAGNNSKWRHEADRALNRPGSRKLVSVGKALARRFHAPVIGETGERHLIHGRAIIFGEHLGGKVKHRYQALIARRAHGINAE